MNACPAQLHIEDLKGYLAKYQQVTDVPLHSYLIIWLAPLALQHENNDSIYCLHYHQLHELPVFDQTNGTVISFSKCLLEIINGYTLPLFEKRLFSFYRPVALSVDKNKQDALLSILETLKQENGMLHVTESRNEIVRVLLKLFLLRLADCNVTQEKDAGSKEDALLTKKYLDLVQVHYIAWKRVSDYADALCVTRNYLNSKIKKITGNTASYHIQQRIILEAKRQARWRGLCMKEVAFYLGFSDLSHFSKFFKNATGINFSSYLKTDGMY